MASCTWNLSEPKIQLAQCMRVSSLETVAGKRITNRKIFNCCRKTAASTLQDLVLIVVVVAPKSKSRTCNVGDYQVTCNIIMWCNYKIKIIVIGSVIIINHFYSCGTSTVLFSFSPQIKVWRDCDASNWFSCCPSLGYGETQGSSEVYWRLIEGHVATFNCTGTFFSFEKLDILDRLFFPEMSGLNP